jgi:hypothetical protein
MNRLQFLCIDTAFSLYITFLLSHIRSPLLAFRSGRASTFSYPISNIRILQPHTSPRLLRQSPCRILSSPSTGYHIFRSRIGCRHSSRTPTVCSCLVYPELGGRLLGRFVIGIDRLLRGLHMETLVDSIVDISLSFGRTGSLPEETVLRHLVWNKHHLCIESVQSIA